MSEEQSPSPWGQGDIRPRPDPTELTRRAVDAAKDELRREIQCLREIIETGLSARDKAILLLEAAHTQIPTQITEAVCHLREMMEQRLIMVEIQFQERDTRAQADMAASHLRVDAAFEAQRALVASHNANITQALVRIEATANKQIDSLITLLQTSAGATDSKISDLKERLTLIEGRTAGITVATSASQVTHTQAQESSKFILAVIVAIGSFLAMIVAIGIAVLKP